MQDFSQIGRSLGAAGKAVGRAFVEVGKFSNRAAILPGVQLFTTLYNAGLPEGERMQCQDAIQDSELPVAYKASPLAWPGHALALCSAAVVLPATDTARSFVLGLRTLHTLGNNTNQPTAITNLYRADKRNLGKIYGVGLAGYLAGLALSVPTTVFVDSLRTIGWVFRAMYNAGLTEQARDRLEGEDHRHLAKTLACGSAGLAPGVALAAVSIVFMDFFKSFALGAKTVVLAGNDIAEADVVKNLYAKENSYRHAAKTYGVGLPGYVLGLALSTVGSVLADSARSLTWSFRTIYNAGLTEDAKDKLEAGEDSRHLAKKLVTGSVGAALGMVFAVTSTVFMDFFKSLVLGGKTVVLAGDDLRQPNALKELYTKENSYRHAAKIYGVGLPGYVLGLVFSTIGAFFADSARSLAWSYRAIYNAGLNADASDKLAGEDHRHLAKKLVTGSAGVVFAAPLAAISIVFMDFFKSLALGAKTVVLAGDDLHQPNALKELYTKENSYRHAAKTYGIGLPGYVLGLVFSTIGAFFADSARSITWAYREIYNAGLNKAANDKLPGEDQRHLAKKLVTGSAGVALAAVLAAISTVFMDFFKSFALGAKTVVLAGNDTAQDADPVKVLYEQEYSYRHAAKIYGVGLPGYVLGLAFSTVGAFFADAGRSIAWVFRAMYNAGLTEEACDKLEGEDKRHLARKLVTGSVGAVLGAVFAAISTVFMDFFKSFALGAKTVVLAGNDIAKPGAVKELYAKENSYRHAVKTYGVGLPGYVLGLAFSTAGAFFADSARSLAWSFRALYNLGLTEGALDRLTGQDKRDVAKKLTVGAVGVILGAVFSAISAVFMDFFKSFALGAKTVVLAGNDTHLEIDPAGALYAKENSFRSAAKIYGVGLPGYLLGLVFSVVGAFFADSARSLAWSFRAIYNAGLTETASDKLAGEDHRHLAKKLVTGSAGVALAAVFAAISTVFMDFFKSFALGAKTVVLVGNDIGLEIDPAGALYAKENSYRHAAKTYGVGLPGYVLGLVFSTVGAFFADSARSLAWSFRAIYNAGLTKTASDKLVGEDHRHLAKKLVTGSAGVALAAVFAAISTVFMDFFKSFALGAKTVVLAGNDTAQDADPVKVLYEQEYSYRHAAKIYGVGLPGYVLGLVFSTIGSFLVDSGRSLFLAFKHAYNLGLNPATAKDFMVSAADNRHGLRKYLSGFIGLVVGGLMGFIGKAVTTLGRFFINVFKHFAFASRSFMNIGTGRFVFKGIKEERSIAPRATIGVEEGQIKQASFLGFMEPVKLGARAISLGIGTAMAAVTTGILSSFIFVTRKLPTILVMGLGLVLSPLTALIRLIYNITSKKQRFTQEAESAVPEVEQKFKNLFSSINGSGRLATDREIVEGGAGQKPCSNSLRKLFFAFYATKSSTEETLDALLLAYRAFRNSNPENKNAFFEEGNESFSQAVEQCKAKYNGCLVSKKDRLENQAEITKVADHVKQYVTSEDDAESKHIPANFYSILRNNGRHLWDGDDVPVAAQVAA
jgi:hypothetical protein